MQYLQRGAAPRRWALKGPGHLFAWRELLMAFPDARLYVNHRDPGKVIPSIASLFCKLRSLFSDEAVDPVAIGAQQLAARSEEHTSELQSLIRISYAVFCLKKKNKK